MHGYFRILLIGLLFFSPRLGPNRVMAAPLSMLFWQNTDIREGKDIRFYTHPVEEGRRQVLLRVERDAKSLWYFPSDAVQTGNDVRIYYQRVEKDQPEYLDQRRWCLGILKSNGEFALPDLGFFPQPWKGPENTVLVRSPHTPTWGGFNVFQMVGGTTQGYRLLYWDQPAEGPAGAMIAASSDGIHWSKEKHTVFTEHNDAYTLVRNPDDGTYLLYQTQLLDWPEKPFRDNLPGKRRVISLRRSKDLRNWSPQQTILVPDELDAPSTEFYLMKVFRYCGRYVGLLMKYYADPSKPGKHSAILRDEILFSSEAIQWNRPHRTSDFGAWTYASPFFFKDSFCLVCYEKEGLVLYQLRKDGLVSCGSEGTGSFWSRPFALESTDLRLNASCSTGSIAVELLDENGLVLDGFDSSRCRFENVDGTDLPLRWGDSDLSGHLGERVHLRFLLDHAEVYSVRSP